jgi:hypothetical protein
VKNKLNGTTHIYVINIFFNISEFILRIFKNIMKRGYEVLSVIACFISSGDIEINISPVVVDTY